MKGRTITTDNFFTSFPLALKLLSKNTSLLETIRANKRELPKSCKQKKDSMARFSTLLYESNGCTLTVYKSKPNKKVLVLSTTHTHVKIDKAIITRDYPKLCLFITTPNLASMSLTKWHESILSNQVPEGGHFKFFSMLSI
ncbi:hypothetical protein ANTPLA_LOCUS8063 [Anthophora plagiata]